MGSASCSSQKPFYSASNNIKKSNLWRRIQATSRAREMQWGSYSMICFLGLFRSLQKRLVDLTGAATESLVLQKGNCCQGVEIALKEGKEFWRFVACNVEPFY